MSLSLLFTLGSWGLRFFKGIGSLFTGGSLDSLLRTIDNGLDDGVEKERVKADVTKKYVDAQSSVVVGRTWWFQLFFVIPMAIHWSALNWVSAFPQWGWTVHPLPEPFATYEGWIITALFVVDGGKALIGSAKK